jgi:hypothetical protein
MAQHFLLSAVARSLSPAKVMRMSDRGAENVFLRLRWPQTDGKPVCPLCGCQICYDCRRSDTQSRWRALPHLKCSHVPECCLIRIAPQRCSRCCIGGSGYGAHQYGDTG